MKPHKLHAALGIAGLLAVCAPCLVRAAQPAGVALSRHTLVDLIRPQGVAGSLGVTSESPRAMGEDVLVGRSPSDQDKLQAFAAKVSYAGVLLLTADRVVRSMDSILEQFQVTRPDGTNLRLEMGPTSEGMSVGLRVSRPIEF